MSEEEAISFEVIRKIQRSEQREVKLTKLPENFFSKVKEYLKSKKRVAARKSDEKAFIEVKNIERLIEDIYNRRERKILNQALISVRTGIPPENLLPEEKEFFERIVELLKERRKKVLLPMFEDVEENVEEELVVFNEDVPEFVGVDMKVYGPFSKGDVAKLPKENAKVLVDAGKVRVMKVKL